MNPFFIRYTICAVCAVSLNEKCSRRLPSSSSSSSRGPSRTGHAELGKKKSINHSQPSRRRRRRRSKMHFSQSPSSTTSTKSVVESCLPAWWYGAHGGEKRSSLCLVQISYTPPLSAALLQQHRNHTHRVLLLLDIYVCASMCSNLC